MIVHLHLDVFERSQWDSRLEINIIAFSMFIVATGESKCNYLRPQQIIAISMTRLLAFYMLQLAQFFFVSYP